MNVISVAKMIEKKLSGLNVPIKIAVMGCEVNGPGEAKEADIGIAGSKNQCVIFKKGRIVKKCPKGDAYKELLGEVYSFEGIRSRPETS